MAPQRNNKRKRSESGSHTGNSKRFNKKLKKAEEPDPLLEEENNESEMNVKLDPAYESLGNASSAIDFYNAVDPSFLKFLSNASLDNLEENNNTSSKKKKRKEKKKRVTQIDDDDDIELNDDPDDDDEEYYSLPIKKSDGTWTRKVIESDIPQVDIHTKFDDAIEQKKQKAEATRQIQMQDERYNKEDVLEVDDKIISDDQIMDDSDDEITQEEQERLLKLKQEQLKLLHTKYIQEMPEEKKVQRELKMKRHIAKISTQILSDPSMHGNLLKSLVELCSDPDEFVQKLAIISLCALFQDIAPSYKINQHQYDNETKLSKEIEQIKNFEVNLIQAYQRYLQLLHVKVKRKVGVDQNASSVRNICLHCLCDLLKSLHHFNFAENNADVLLKLLNSQDSTLRTKAFHTFRAVFKNDITFELSAYIVESIAMLAKKKNYNIQYEVIGCLLSLPLTNQLKDKFLPKDVATSKRKKGKKKFTLNVETNVQKDKIEFQTGVTDHLKYQTIILRNLIVTYVRLLKSDYKSPLLFSSLEGLSKFAHLLNVELIYDLLSYIRLLMQSLSDDIPLKTLLQLLCTIAQLTKGMGETINIDMSSTFTQLYDALLKVVMYEQEDPTTQKLLIQAISMMIFQTSHEVPPQRAAAVVKRLATCILSSQPQLALPMLFLMNSILTKYPRCRELLSTESFGISDYRFDTENPDHANALSTNLWEFYTITRFSHPHISRLSHRMVDIHSKRVVTQEDLKIMKDLTIEEYDSLVDSYTFNGNFFPEPRKPKKEPNDLKFRKRSLYSIHKSSSFFKACLAQLEEEELSRDEIITKFLGFGDNKVNTSRSSSKKI